MDSDTKNAITMGCVAAFLIVAVSVAAIVTTYMNERGQSLRVCLQKNPPAQCSKMGQP